MGAGRGRGRSRGFGDGGRGRGRGGGGRGGRGGETQRWWDPEWRKERLAKMRRERPPAEDVDWEDIEDKVQRLAYAGPEEQEVLIRAHLSQEQVADLAGISRAQGLFFRTYGRGTSTVHCVSRVPLPEYRADLDPRAQTERQVDMSPFAQAQIRDALRHVGTSLQRSDEAAPATSSVAPPTKRLHVAAEAPRVVKDAWDDDDDDDDYDYDNGSGGGGGGGIGNDHAVAESSERDGGAPAVRAVAVGGRGASGSVAAIRATPVAPSRPSADAKRAVTVEAVGSSGNNNVSGNNNSIAKQGPGALKQTAPPALSAVAAPARSRGSSAAAGRLLEFRKRLPAWGKRGELLAAVAAHQVVVVSGETGCGKTTQLPQFLLEEADDAGRGGVTSIVCTQPRRISAISVAQRVAEERGESLGATVGYQIRLESRRSEDTRLLFCTTGVLLRRLVGDPSLSGVSHVIVDEIHERGCTEDFLLIVLRDLLPKRPDLRVVLMSATLNSHLFCDYFHGCPRVEIPGFTHPVRDLFLEDILESSSITIRPDTSRPTTATYRGHHHRRSGNPHRGRGRTDSANIINDGNNDKDDYSRMRYEPDEELLARQGCKRSTVESLWTWAEGFNNAEPKDAKTDLKLVESVVEHICVNEGDGAVLVFLTGWDEISNLHKAMQGNAAFAGNKVRVLPLHGSMPTAHQREIFDRPPPGVRKVVLATNIAETSITIDDVVFVVDCGKAKEKSYDPLNKLATLLPQWISQASARQRRGRAGRVQPGKCYKLYPRQVHDAYMSEYQIPEMLRTPLEELCLQIKSLKLGSIEAFLSRALQPPDPRAVSNAKSLLETIGALDPDTESLTPLGQHLAHLPVDPLVGKMVLYGAVCKCLDPILTIAAGLAHRDPWVIPLERKEQADRARQQLAAGTQSDHLALVAAYDNWRGIDNAAARREYCWRNFLREQTLEMMGDMRVQFAELLADAGFLARGEGGRPHARSSRVHLESEIARHSNNAQRTELVRAVICAGMFPNVAVIQQRKNRATFRTAEDGTVQPHLSSVIAAERHFTDRFLVYSQKVKTANINLTMSTVVSDYALLLFGGTLTRKSDTGSLTMLSGTVTFQTEPGVADLIVRARGELERLLMRKAEEPGLDLDGEAAVLVGAVLNVLCQESTSHRSGRGYYDRERGWAYDSDNPVNRRR